MEKVNITSEMLDQAVLVDTTRTVKMSTSFDAEAKKAGESETIQVSVNLSDVAIADILDDALARLVIKVNGMLKKHAVDSETYRDYLAQNDHQFSFSYKEIGGSSRRSDPLTQGRNAYAKMTEEQKEVFRKLLAEND